MTDVRALQVLLDGGVTDPRALLAALPSGTLDDVGRAIGVMSAQALARPTTGACGTASSGRVAEMYWLEPLQEEN